MIKYGCKRSTFGYEGTCDLFTSSRSNSLLRLYGNKPGSVCAGNWRRIKLIQVYCRRHGVRPGSAWRWLWPWIRRRRGSGSNQRKPQDAVQRLYHRRYGRVNRYLRYSHDVHHLGPVKNPARFWATPFLFYNRKLRSMRTAPRRIQDSFQTLIRCQRAEEPWPVSRSGSCSA